MALQIIVPEPIQCVNVATKEPIQREAKGPEVRDGKLINHAVLEPDGPWSLYRFLAIFVGQRPEWQKPLNKALRFSKFLAQLDEAPVGAPCPIDDELWRGIRDTLIADDFELPFPYNTQLPPLCEAILNVSEIPTLKEVASED